MGNRDTTRGYKDLCPPAVHLPGGFPPDSTNFKLNVREISLFCSVSLSLSERSRENNFISIYRSLNMSSA